MAWVRTSERTKCKKKLYYKKNRTRILLKKREEYISDRLEEMHEGN